MRAVYFACINTSQNAQNRTELHNTCSFQLLCLKERDAQIRSFHRALRDVGFLQIIGHGVSSQLRAEVQQEARTFFYLDHDTKMSIAPHKYNPDNQHYYRGYFPATVFGKEVHTVDVLLNLYALLLYSNTFVMVFADF